MMPRNTEGRPIRAADYNRSNGFSPGQIIVTHVPAARPDAAAAPCRSTTWPRSFAKNAPIVVIDAKTGRRQLIWAELDSQATNPRRRALLVHPGANWREGRRYIVALRNLRDSSGRELRAQRAFRRLRDGDAGGRRYDDIFRRLERARASGAATSTSPGTSRSRRSRTWRSACSTSATAPSPSSAIASWAT